MRNFYKLAAGVDVGPLLYALSINPDLWDQNTLRTTHEQSPHTQVSDIWLRFSDLSLYKQTGDASTVPDEHDSICYPAWYALPQAQELVFQLMSRVRGIRLGRVLITRLEPGKVIAPHRDGDAHAEKYERHHIILQNGKGCNFRCGDEVVCMNPGEVWWFANQIEHEVVNHGAETRISLIVDIEVDKGAKRAN